MVYDKHLCWRCPRCGHWQARENRKWIPGLTQEQENSVIQKLILKCERCKKYTKFHDKRLGGSRVEHQWLGDDKKAEQLINKLTPATKNENGETA